MTKLQTNKLLMYRTVQAYLESNPDKVSAMPALAERAVHLRELLTELESIAIKQTSIAKGKTDKKAEAKEQLSEKLNTVRCALYALGRKLQDAELMAQADVNESRLRQSRDLDLLRTAGIMHREAVSRHAQLADFGISDADLNDLVGAKEAFSLTIDSRDSAVAERVGARVDLAGIFDEVDDLLNEDIDTIMQLLRSRELEFYNGYTAARVIKDLGVRRQNGGTSDVGQRESETAGVRDVVKPL